MTLFRRPIPTFGLPLLYELTRRAFTCVEGCPWPLCYPPSSGPFISLHLTLSLGNSWLPISPRAPPLRYLKSTFWRGINTLQNALFHSCYFVITFDTWLGKGSWGAEWIRVWTAEGSHIARKMRLITQNMSRFRWSGGKEIREPY